jgi:hypothetical protein
MWQLIEQFTDLRREGSESPNDKVAFPDRGIRFDSRMLVPVVCKLVMDFIAMHQAALPEYRSLGKYKKDFADFATAIDELAAKLLQNLARTVYTPEHFMAPFFRKKVVNKSWPVGAIDLSLYTQVAISASPWRDHSSISANKIPTMNWNWDARPYAKMAQRGGVFPFSYITNPHELADMANAEAEKFFGTLLAMSGWPQLMALGGLVRHLGTDPDKSETVAELKPPGYVILKQEDEPIEVSDHAIPFLDEPITAQATLSKRTLKMRVKVSTQPHRARATLFPYKIYLCTTLSGESDDQTILSQVQICPQEDIFQYTPQESLTLSGEVPLKAITFDWYVPLDLGFLEDGLELEYIPIKFPVRSSQFTAELATRLVNPIEVAQRWERFEGLDDVPENWEKHDNRETVVRLSYELNWFGKGNYFDFKLYNRPEDRNFAVLLVVEETLPMDPDGIRSSDIRIRSVFRFPVNGQLTIIPQSFFDQRAKARGYAAKIFSEFAKRNRAFKDIPPWSPEPLLNQWAQVRFNPDVPIESFVLQEMAQDAVQRDPIGLQAIIEELAPQRGGPLRN